MNHSGPDFNRQSTLWNFEHVFGWVTNSANVLAALQVAAQKAGRNSIYFSGGTGRGEPSAPIAT